MATTNCSVQNRTAVKFAGQLVSPVASCHPTRGTLIIRRDEVVFTPDDGTWIIPGKVVGNTVEASRSRPSFDHKNYVTELKATLSASKIVGTYITPTCTYAVDLTSFD